MATATRDAFVPVDNGAVGPTIGAELTISGGAPAAVGVSIHEPGRSGSDDDGRWAEVFLTPSEAGDLRDALDDALMLIRGGDQA